MNYNDLKAFIVYSNNMQDINKTMEEYNPWKEHEVLIVLTAWYLIWLVTKELIH